MAVVVGVTGRLVRGGVAVAEAADGSIDDAFDAAADADRLSVTRGDVDLGVLVRVARVRLGLSARAYHRLLRLSRTIADLDESDTITARHMSEAIHFRLLDRQPIR